jgi:hypothetical protein
VTRAEALAEARRRWGENDGRAWRQSITSGWPLRRTIIGWRYYVGVFACPAWATVPYRRVAGESTDGWDAAFADADRREGVRPAEQNMGHGVMEPEYRGATARR